MFGRKKKRLERKIYTSGYHPEGKDEKLLSFSVKEAYKSIRTNIVLSLVKDGCKIITMTSAMPSEGKSTTIANVAVSLSKAFYKVLLIDCDLLKPRLHRTLKISNNQGLSNVLSKMSTFDESVQVLKNYNDLNVLTAGIPVPNPSEMLGSDRMKDLLATISEKYDYIFIDTPPINVLSDGLSLARISDGVVLIVRQGHSTKDEVRQAMDSLKFISAKVLGIVYNDATVDKTGKPYYGRSSKHKRYGSYSTYSYAAMYGDKDRTHSESKDEIFIHADNESEGGSKESGEK